MSQSANEKLLRIFESNESLQALYNKLLPTLERYILKNSGTVQDARDVFQDAILITYRRVYESEFELTSSIETFIFSVSKKKWLYELRKRKDVLPVMDVMDDSEGNDASLALINHEKVNLFLKYLGSLTGGCKDVMELFFEGYKMKEIAKKLKFSSEGYARKRKHDCQGKLIKAIKNDPLFNELSNE